MCLKIAFESQFLKVEFFRSNYLYVKVGYFDIYFWWVEFPKECEIKLWLNSQKSAIMIKDKYISTQ